MRTKHKLFIKIIAFLFFLIVIISGQSTFGFEVTGFTNHIPVSFEFNNKKYWITFDKIKKLNAADASKFFKVVKLNIANLTVLKLDTACSI